MCVKTLGLFGVYPVVDREVFLGTTHLSVRRKVKPLVNSLMLVFGSPPDTRQCVLRLIGVMLNNQKGPQRSVLGASTIFKGKEASAIFFHCAEEPLSLVGRGLESPVA